MTTVTYHPDTQSFTIADKAWTNSYPIAELPKWLGFYRKMKVDYPKSGDSYDADIAALAKLAVELGVDVGS